MTYIIDYFLPYSSCFPRLSAADTLFLFGVKKEQKTPAENLFICCL